MDVVTINAPKKTLEGELRVDKAMVHICAFSPSSPKKTALNDCTQANEGEALLLKKVSCKFS